MSDQELIQELIKSYQTIIDAQAQVIESLNTVIGALTKELLK